MDNKVLSRFLGKSIANLLLNLLQISLKHENILQMMGYFHDDTSVFLVLEEASYGELFKNVIAKTKAKRLAENIAANYVYLVVSFVAEVSLHSCAVLIFTNYSPRVKRYFIFRIIVFRIGT